MAENDVEKRIISIQIDEQAKGKLLRGMGEIQSATKKTALETLKIGESAKQAASLQKRVYQESGKALEDQIRTLTDYRKAANAAADAAKEIKVPSGGGGLGGQVADIRGALGSIGGGNAALEAAGGISDAIQAFGGLNPAALTAAGSIGALSVATSLFTQEMDKQKNAVLSRVQAEREANEAAVFGRTTEDAQQRKTELEQLIAAEQELLETQQLNLAQGGQAILNEFGVLGVGIAQFVGPLAGLGEGIAQSQTKLTDYRSELAALEGQLGDGSLAANDTAAAEEELARTREVDAQKAIAQTEAANQRILALNEQRDSAIENRLIARSNAAQSTKLESGFAEENEKAKLTKHLADLQGIREAGYQKELSLAKEIADLPAQQAKDLGAVTTKGTKELQKLNDDYFANQIKATKDFAKESGRINQEVAKNARRIAEDLADRLSDAARDNDVVAFLQAEKEGQKELRRNAEDAKDAEKQRQEDFLDQQEEQRQAYNQRQQEILRQVEEEKQKVIQSYAEKKQALEQQIQQERANTQQAIANAQARYQQEEALEDQQAKRNAQRLQLRDQQEQAAFQRSLNAINSKVNAELQGLARIQQAAMSLGSSMSSKSNYGKPAPSQYVSPYANGQPSSSGGFGSKGGINVNVSMSNNVGDVASMTALNAASNQIQQNVQQAVMRAVQGAQG
jgi:hypothetical protein